MLLLKRVKYCRVHHSHVTGRVYRGSQVAYSDFGLQALGLAWIISNQIEAARIAVTRYTKRFGKVWTKIFPDGPVTKKSAETRMDFGRGALEYWVAVVKPDGMISEIDDVAKVTVREATRLAANRLSIRCKLVKKEETGGEQS